MLIIAAQITVLLLGGLILLVCGFGVVAPALLIRTGRNLWASPFGMFLAVLIRLLLGGALLLVASASRFPTTFRILGVITLLAALIVPFVGHARIGRIMDWGATLPAWIMRLWLSVGVLFAAFLLCATPGSR
jgi:hypothetical protein